MVRAQIIGNPTSATIGRLQHRWSHAWSGAEKEGIPNKQTSLNNSNRHKRVQMFFVSSHVNFSIYTPSCMGDNTCTMYWMNCGTSPVL
jgi:hypothetical protein